MDECEIPILKVRRRQSAPERLERLIRGLRPGIVLELRFDPHWREAERGRPYGAADAQASVEAVAAGLGVELEFSTSGPDVLSFRLRPVEAMGFKQLDPWVETVDAYTHRLPLTTPVRTQGVLRFLGAPATRGNQMRVAGILRHLGYQRCQYGQERLSGWRKPYEARELAALPLVEVGP